MIQLLLSSPLVAAAALNELLKLACLSLNMMSQNANQSKTGPVLSTLYLLHRHGLYRLGWVLEGTQS